MKSLAKIICTVVVFLLIYPGSFFSYWFIKSSFDPYWTTRIYENLEKSSNQELERKLHTIDPFSPRPAIAMEILASRKDKNVVDELIGFVDSSNKYRKAKAIWALGEIGDERAVVPLSKIISKGEKHPNYLDAKRALGKIQGKIASDLNR